MQHTCPNSTLSSYNHSVSFRAFFLLLQPAWLWGKGKEIACGCQGIQLDHPACPFSVSHICMHPCLWKSLRGCGTLRHHQSWMYHTTDWHMLFQGSPDLLEVQCCIKYGGSGNHFIVKFQVCIISRLDMCHLDMLPDDISKLSTPQPMTCLRWGHNSFCCPCQVKFVNFRHHLSSTVPIDVGTPALFCY